MAAHILWLRIALMIGAFRGGAAHTWRTAAGLVVLISAVAGACFGLWHLTEIPVHTMTTVFVGASLITAFALAPLVIAVTDPLEPRRFALLGLDPGPLPIVLALVGCVSVPVLAVTTVAVADVAWWSSQGVPVWVGIVSVACTIATCALLARLMPALIGSGFRQRRSPELSGLLLLLVVAVVVPLMVFFTSLEWRGDVLSQLVNAAAILAATPMGAAGALPSAWGTAGFTASLVIAVVTVIALLLAWVLVVHHQLSNAPRPARARERGGLGWFAVTPGTPAGAVAARSLTYWFGDRRYLVNLLVVPVTALFTTVPLLIAGVPGLVVALVPVPFMALFLGWLPHDDLAYDSTALWLHVSSGLRGIADRIGRIIPVLIIGLPVLAVSITVAISLYGRWMLLPALTGVSIALFLSGLGLSSIASVVAPYPVSGPGESPFRQPQRTTSSGVIAQSVVMVGALVLSAPTVWAARGVFTGDPSAASWALGVGTGTGVIVLLLGLVIGGAQFNRRSDQLMQFIETN